VPNNEAQAQEEQSGTVSGSGQVWLRFDEAPVIGRTAELESLSSALTTALRGRGGVLVLRGEAGVGKTRLADTLLRELTGVLILQGKATERETPRTYEAITGLLRSLRRQCAIPTLRHLSERLEPFRPALAALLPEWRTSEADAAAGTDKLFLFEAVTELLREQAARQPVCVFLDDAHWMDENSLELLQYLVEGLIDEPFALLLSIREEEPNPWLDTLLVELRHGGRFSAWVVRRLGREATAALAETLLEAPSGSLPPGLVEHLYSGSAGNPFYLQEMISGLLESRALARSGDRLTWIGSGLPVVTGGMLTAVQRRVQRLSPADRAVLEAASVLGEAIEAPLLQAVVGEIAADEEAFSRSLATLTDRHFLVTGNGLSEVSLRFAHPKVREAVYHSLSTGDRRRWHAEAARVLRALPPSHPARARTAIGYHLSLAEEGREALPWLLESGEKLMISFSLTEPAWYFRRAEHHLERLRLTEPSDWIARQEGKLWLLRGHLNFAQGRKQESQEAFLRSWDCLQGLPIEDDAELKATAALFRAQILIKRGDLDRAEAFLREQHSLIEPALGGSGRLLYLDFMLAHIHACRREWAGWEAVLRDGLQRALAVEAEEHIGEFARRLHATALARGREDDASALRELMDGRAGSNATPSTLFRRHSMLAAAARRRADWEAARVAAAAMLALAQQYHHRPFVHEALSLQLTLRALSEPAAALAPLQEEAAKAEQADDPVRQGWALAAFAAAAAETGAWQPAEEAARKLLSLAPEAAAEPEWFGWTHQAYLILAEAALVHGDAGEALSWLDQTVPNDVPPGEFWTSGERMTLRAWALAERGEAQALPAIEAARPAIAETGDLRLRAIMQTQLAHAIGRLARDPRQAGSRRALVEEATTLCESARPVLEACRSEARLRRLEEGLGVTSPASTPAGDRPARGRRPQLSHVNSLPRATESLSPPKLHVQLLREFGCAVDGQMIPLAAWGSRKARSFFQYLLLCRGRPVPAGDLLELFWPDLDMDGARHALRSTLHRIRRALEPSRPAGGPSSFLHVVEDTVCVRLGPEASVDVYEFEDRLSQARRRDAQGDPATAERLREEAIALYTGDLLPQAAYESWALGPREGLREQYLSTLARLAEAAISRDHPEAALAHAEKMLEAEPTHESGLRILVRALAILGRPTEAVRRFDLFSQRLAADLDLIPERETRQLMESLGRQR
jgi:DNA-binding SARP family transcriptional activator